MLKKQEQTVDVFLKMGNIGFRIYIQPGIDAPRNGHRLFIVLAGNVELDADDRTFYLEAGDLILVCPHIKYTTNIPAGTKLFVLDIVYEYMQTDDGEDLYGPFSDVFSDVSCLQLKKLTDVVQIVSMITEDLSGKYVGVIYRLRTHLAGLLFLLSDTVSMLKRDVFSIEKTCDHSRYTNMRAMFIDTYLNENFRENATMQILAQKLSLSEKQVGRIIKKMYRRTFYQQLTYLRIGEAKQQLTASDLPVEEIAYAVGYATYTGFYKAFKQATGMTPTEYREKN